MFSSCQDERKIFIVVEKKDEEVAANTIELFQVERSLANQVGGIFCSAVLGHQTGEILRNTAKFLVEVYFMDSPLLATFRNDLYPYLLDRLCQQMSPEIILIGHTLNNLDLERDQRGKQ